MGWTVRNEPDVLLAPAEQLKQPMGERDILPFIIPRHIVDLSDLALTSVPRRFRLHNRQHKVNRERCSRHLCKGAPFRHR